LDIPIIVLRIYCWKKNKIENLDGIEKLVNNHICVKAYEECIAHYLQVSQVIPLLPSVVVNVYIVIFALVTILAFNLLLLIVILVMNLVAFQISKKRGYFFNIPSLTLVST
jgi:hypothetical protein